MSYYANGLFKAKSTSILKKNQLETLISKTDEEFFELLKNYGFGFNDSIERFYEKEINNLKKELIDALGSLNGLKVFFYPFDILNTKLIYKELKENISTEQYYLKAGNISPELIYQALKYDNYSGLNDYVDLFEEIKKIEDEDYQKINYKIDALFLKKIKKEVKSSKPLKDYLEVKLNLTNLLSLMRVRALNLTKESLNQVIHPTSTLTKERLLSLYSEPTSKIRETVLNLGYYSASRSVAQYEKDDDIENLEKNLESDLAEILIDYSFESIGLGYIMSYIYMKLTELKNIKFIYYNRMTSLNKLIVLER